MSASASLFERARLESLNVAAMFPIIVYGLSFKTRWGIVLSREDLPKPVNPSVAQIRIWIVMRKQILNFHEFLVCFALCFFEIDLLFELDCEGLSYSIVDEDLEILAVRCDDASQGTVQPTHRSLT